MTFKVSNLGSKRPNLQRAYVIGVCNNLGTTVNIKRMILFLTHYFSVSFAILQLKKFKDFFQTILADTGQN